jgi:hypothetical protein
METYYGHVRTTADAIKIFEACRLGYLLRVRRRLSEKERQSIKSGSVFVWDEQEAGMRRWTDGKSWSASKVSGSFLTYQEMKRKQGGGTFAPAPTRQRIARKTPDSGRESDQDADMDSGGPDGYKYEQDSLIKQSFSITTSSGQHLHLISYYSRHHANSPDLPQPTTDPALRHIIPAKKVHPETVLSGRQKALSATHQSSIIPLVFRNPPPMLLSLETAMQASKNFSYTTLPSGSKLTPKRVELPPIRQVRHINISLNNRSKSPLGYP